MTTGERPAVGVRLEPRWALGALVAVLVAANVARSLVVPGRWHFAYNLATAGLAVLLGVAGGLGVGELGLRRDRWRAGARLGGAAFALISLVVLVGVLTGVVADDGAAVERNEVLWKALVVIPIGTVLVEELIFRGALDGLLRAVFGPTAQALWIGAVLFGLWHVVPAWRSGSSGLDGVDTPIQVLLTFAGTTFAGLVFSWLRLRADSLLAPVLAHVGTNSATLVLVWWLG